MKKLIATFIALLTLHTLTHAELIWTEANGWELKGGVIAEYLGTDEDAQNALELMNKARAKQEKGSRRSALGLYDDVIDDYPNSVLAPEALYQTASIYTERNQFEKAYKFLTKIIKRYPDYPNFNQVIGKMFEIGETMGNGVRPRYWGIIPGFRNYQAAQEILEGVVSQAPYSEYAPIALMNIALIATKRDEVEEAIDALDRLINGYPQSMFAEDAYLNLAQTYASLVQGPEYDQGATREAISYFEDFMILYKDSSNRYDAEAGLYYMKETLAENKLLAGDFYFNYRNDNVAAKTFYNEAITVDPKSAGAEKARQMIAAIDAGTQPAKTPVDWLFGRYESRKEAEYQNTSEVEAPLADPFKEVPLDQN